MDNNDLQPADVLSHCDVQSTLWLMRRCAALEARLEESVKLIELGKRAVLASDEEAGKLYGAIHDIGPLLEKLIEYVEAQLTTFPTYRDPYYQPVLDAIREAITVHGGLWKDTGDAS